MVCPKCASGSIRSVCWAGVVIYTCGQCGKTWRFDTLTRRWSGWDGAARGG